MKRAYFPLLIILPCLIATFARAETPPSPALPPGAFTAEDFALVRTTDKAVIKLGMSRAEAEKLLGQSVSQDPLLKSLHYAGGIGVYYRQDAAAGILVSYAGEPAAPYATPRGIGGNSTRREVEAAYGKGVGGSQELTYYAEHTETGFVRRESPQGAADLAKIYVLYFTFDAETGKVGWIYAMDARFSITWR